MLMDKIKPLLGKKSFKKGEINVDDDKKNNVKLVKIKYKKSFNWILKKALSSFLHYYPKCYFLLSLLISVVLLITKMLH